MLSTRSLPTHNIDQTKKPTITARIIRTIFRSPFGCFFECGKSFLKRDKRRDYNPVLFSNKSPDYERRKFLSSESLLVYILSLIPMRKFLLASLIAVSFSGIAAGQ